jgi:hypothetical protein
MSDKKESDIDTSKPYGEPEVMATAVPAGGNEPPIPSGHARFYCNKCHTVRSACSCFRYGCSAGPVALLDEQKRNDKMRAFRLCSTNLLLSLFYSLFSLAAVRPSRQGDFLALRELHGIQLHYTR